MPYRNAEVRRLARRVSYLKRKETILAQERSYRKTNPASKRQIQYKRRYGITIEQFDLMVEIQDRKCALCRDPLKLGHLRKIKTVHIDHCHKTQKVPGVLCARCNLGLGMFGDDPERLRVAIRYLEGAL